MQFEWFQHDGELVVIDVSRELRHDLTVYVARLSADPTVETIGADPVAAVRLLRDRFLEHRAARATVPSRQVRDQQTVSGRDRLALVQAKDASLRPNRPVRVLVVDDDESCVTVTRAVCEMDGHTVEVARNGVEAIVRLAAGVFDAVITDLAMPGIDGVTLVKRIRAGSENPQMPVVGMTAAGLAGKDALKAAGVDVLLPKPYDPLALRDALRGALKRVPLPTPG